jgi:hypothetical protein
MAGRVGRILIAAAAFATGVGAADAQSSLRNLPVAAMKLVAPAQYRDAYSALRPLLARAGSRQRG